MRRWFCALALGVGLAGCRHRVAIETSPAGASVHRGREQIGLTPMETTFWWFPGRKVPVTLRMKGQRDVTLRLDRDMSLWRATGDLLRFWRWGRFVRLRPRATHQVIFIREHGGAGTWTPDDVEG